MTAGAQERSDRGIGIEEDIDDLYGVPPDAFLARRKELVAAAKKRGDADGAKLIGTARRPTAAAWVVNLLVRRDPTARPRLSELSEALRAAHSSMDGPRIRELTTVQRKLIDGLVRTAIDAAGHADATAALRNDVTDTLQAAIADPDVAARLGRLTKAEQWSGSAISARCLRSRHRRERSRHRPPRRSYPRMTRPTRPPRENDSSRPWTASRLRRALMPRRPNCVLNASPSLSPRAGATRNSLRR